MGMKNGFKRIKGKWNIYEVSRYYDQTQYNLMFPGVTDYEAKHNIVEKFEYRRLRADIREMKLGSKGSSNEGSSMSVFELKKNKGLGIGGR